MSIKPVIRLNDMVGGGLNVEIVSSHHHRTGRPTIAGVYPVTRWNLGEERHVKYDSAIRKLDKLIPYLAAGGRRGNTKIGLRSIYRITAPRNKNNQDKPEDGKKKERLAPHLSYLLQGFLRRNVESDALKAYCLTNLNH